MTFEAGRKLGLNGGLIAVILPVIALVLAYFSVSSISSTLPFGTPRILNPFFGYSNLTIIAFAFIGLTSLAGLIVFILATHSLSKCYNETSIFKNALWGFILSSTGTIIAFLVEFSLLKITIVPRTFNSSITLVAGTYNPVPVPHSFPTFTFMYFVAFALVIIFAIINALLYVRVFNKLAEKSGVKRFRTAGLLYLIGAFLSIVVIGAIVVWVAWIFAATAFRSLKPFQTPTVL